MKKLINGKLYNTRNSIAVASWDNGVEISDPAYCEETLFKSKMETYFIYQKKYDGLDIRELDPVAAFEWLQEHGMKVEARREFPQMFTEI
ncbi:MAG: hypothetical protein WBL02_10210 [Methanomethylovorans sp.]|uniref:hypothetical protein n=1 Tax=Methanomethylovorans sp. TaxID=2758717 RepID=UPI000B05E401|nr:hypothetical protein [Methanomethylovorans sp.]